VPLPSGAPTPVPASSTRRRWFRVVALLIPLLLLLLIEFVLRLAGYGYPTEFFQRRDIAGRPALVDNPEFTRRFFPPGLARSPQPFLLSVRKDTGVRRIFVFGESAAMGDPEPAFGFARLLETMLRAREPEKKFEVVNVAITAINSHVIRQIARDCASREGDVWIVYMGNNEVVGPYGAGTVFGAQTPPLSAIRAGIALRGTRLGQAADALKWRLAGRGRTPATWEGMEMFLRQQIPADDRRMARVYENFQRNLADILDLGARAGAKLVLSTVAVNWKDCPPFASLHRTGLTSAQVEEWNRHFRQGIEAEAATNSAAALRAYAEAVRLDDRYAELHFRIGRCHWTAGEFTNAARAFALAAELDTLRFRCDARLDQIIRETAQRRPDVKLVDVRSLIAQASPQGVPGEEYFYEHVHFNLAGNYLVARALAEVLSDERSDRGTGARPPVPSLEDCARRLGCTDWDRYQVVDEVFKRLQQPPFTQQLGHEDRDHRLQAQRAALRPALGTDAFPAHAAVYRAALALAPDDWVLHENFARVLEAFGEITEAEKQWREVVRLLPHYEQGYYGLANVLDAAGRSAEAMDYFRQSLARRPDRYEPRNGLGLALASQGRLAEARQEFERALRQKPDFAEARVNLGHTFAQLGQTDQAVQEYEAVLRANSNSVAAHVNLGKVFAAQGRTAEAIAHYQEALRIGPDNAVAHYNLGNALFAQKNPAARAHFAQAVELNPKFAEARYNLGLTLAQEGRGAEALVQFQEAVRAKPEFVEARLNLGVALAKGGRYDEAIEQFREVLRLEPDNAPAKKFLDQATAKGPRRP
jgi:tetratricopeptide (TPR) repeat protein